MPSPRSCTSALMILAGLSDSCCGLVSQALKTSLPPSILLPLPSCATSTYSTLSPATSASLALDPTPGPEMSVKLTSALTRRSGEGLWKRVGERIRGKEEGEENEEEEGYEEGEEGGG